MKLTNIDKPPDQEIVSREDIAVYLREEGEKLDARITDRLKEMGIELPDSKSPRALGTEVINEFTSSNRNRVLQLFARLWMKSEDLLSPEECRPPTEPLGILTPSEVRGKITRQLYNLYDQGCFNKAQDLLQTYDASDPRGYIAHMDEMSGGHGRATSSAFALYQRANDLNLSGPYVEIGAGPGKITWDFINNGLLDANEDITLVEPNKNWAQYAEQLMKRIAQRVQVLNTTGEAFNLEQPAQTITSALCLQWITGDGVLPKILDNGIRNLEVGGRWFDAGEMPKDVFGTTVQALEKGLDIGFEGAYDWNNMAQMFEERGMELDPQVAVCRITMPKPNEKFLGQLKGLQKPIVRLAEAMNDHILVGAGWVKTY